MPAAPAPDHIAPHTAPLKHLYVVAYKRYAYGMSASAVALIVDIVGSRTLDDREAAQNEVLEVFSTVHATRPFRDPLWATVGDEFQAVFDHVGDSLRATAIAQLLFPPELDCRFGLGMGEVRTVGHDTTIQDGSAWWFAREAIVEAHAREDKANPYLRTWFASDGSHPETTAVVNSYLLVRDHTIRRMTTRERRIAAGALLGRRQTDLATDEGISQSAVSQSLQRSGGAALVAAHQVLDELTPR